MSGSREALGCSSLLGLQEGLWRMLHAVDVAAVSQTLHQLVVAGPLRVQCWVWRSHKCERKAAPALRRAEWKVTTGGHRADVD